MSEKIMCEGRNFDEEMRRFIGETVTIFTTSGGESGEGFTGVVLSVSRNFVRLITQVGTAPGCPLGNSCGRHERCDRRNDDRRFRVGSVTDIPINRITAFVHNAI